MRFTFRTLYMIACRPVVFDWLTFFVHCLADFTFYTLWNWRCSFERNYYSGVNKLWPGFCGRLLWVLMCNSSWPFSSVCVKPKRVGAWTEALWNFCDVIIQTIRHMRDKAHEPGTQFWRIVTFFGISATNKESHFSFHSVRTNKGNVAVRLWR